MKYVLTLILALAACATKETTPTTVPGAGVDLNLGKGVVLGSGALVADLSACTTPIYNRGKPPLSVVEDIVSILKAMPDFVFEANSKYDIYASLRPQLGPWKSTIHRRAVMAEALIVLAGFESSWNYKEGRDMSASNTSSCTEEAGMFQTSGNANVFSPDLVALQSHFCGNTTCEGFKTCMKAPVKPFVIGHTAVLLRQTISHHGPLLRKDVNKYVRPSCVAALEKRFQ